MEPAPKRQYNTIVIDNKPQPSTNKRTAQQQEASGSIRTFQQPSQQHAPSSLSLQASSHMGSLPPPSPPQTPTPPSLAQTGEASQKHHSEHSAKLIQQQLHLHKELAAASSISSHGQSRPKQRTAAMVMARPTVPKRRHGSIGDIDFEQEVFPFSVAWTPLPVLSWFVPIIGHTGISTSKGFIYDFSDDFRVSVDNFSFGSPTKYYQFDPSEIDLNVPITTKEDHHSNKSQSHGRQEQQHQQLHGPATAANPNRVGITLTQEQQHRMSQMSQRERRAFIWDRAIEETSDYYAKSRYNLYFRNCHQYIACVLNKCNYAQAADWTQNDVWWMITFMSTYTGYMGAFRQWGPFMMILLAAVCVCVVLF